MYIPLAGDGTPMDMWDMSGWVSIPQNQGFREPRVLTPHLIKHMNPAVKLIVILREPVERSVSVTCIYSKPNLYGHVVTIVAFTSLNMTVIDPSNL